MCELPLPAQQGSGEMLEGLGSVCLQERECLVEARGRVTVERWHWWLSIWPPCLTPHQAESLSAPPPAGPALFCGLTCWVLISAGNLSSDSSQRICWRRCPHRYGQAISAEAPRGPFQWPAGPRRGQPGSARPDPDEQNKLTHRILNLYR